MQPTRPDWTPAVVMTALFAVAMAGVVWFLGPMRGRDDVGPGHDRRLPPAGVNVWVGDLGAELRGVLAPVIGDPGPDELHAAQWNEHLRWGEGKQLGFARLVVVNTGQEPRELEVGDGTVRVRLPGGQSTATLDLTRQVAEGRWSPPEGWAFVARVLGPLRDRIEVPAGGSVSLLVPFDHDVDLAEAEGVSAADGEPWSLRRRTQDELRRLVVSREASDVEDLLR
ncbi:MAG: hypothetical protein H6826_11225 [Planctomycetes bacterium]|nr:hypothetical protein [Planctomycetota bacterium]